MSKKRITSARPIQDWTDAGAYPRSSGVQFSKEFKKLHFSSHMATDDLRMYFWRWEFLRRHPQYQKDWNSYVAASQPLIDAYGIFGPASDPNQEVPLECMFFRDDLRENNVAPLVRFYIDLYAPLKPQLDKITRQVGIYKKADPSFVFARGLPYARSERLPPKATWNKLLRALDAYAAGATFSEIGRKLTGNATSINSIRQGRRLVEYGFKLQSWICRLPQQQLKEPAKG